MISSALMPCGLGTRKPPSATSGACASTTSRGRQGRGSSGRSALGTSTTCDVGGTPSRSSSPIFSMCSRMFDSSPEIFVDLLVAELQARQAGDVQDLLTVDHGSGESRRRARRRRARLGRRVRALRGVGALVLDRQPATDGQDQRGEQSEPCAVAQHDDVVGARLEHERAQARARRTRGCPASPSAPRQRRPAPRAGWWRWRCTSQRAQAIASDARRRASRGVSQPLEPPDRARRRIVTQPLPAAGPRRRTSQEERDEQRCRRRWPRPIPDAAACSPHRHPRRLQGVAQQAGDRHRPHAAGHRRDRAGDLDRRRRSRRRRAGRRRSG